MTKLDAGLWPSINALSGPLVQQLIDNARALQIGVSTHESGATVVDAGILHAGSAEAGRLIAEICMGGLGKVELSDKTAFKDWPSGIKVQSKSPVLACLGSQYAGWALSNDSGHEKFFSLGSGPARAIAQREELFKELGYKDSAQNTVLVLETDKIPPMAIIEKITRDTGVQAKNLTLILTPTTSIAGVVQIVGRVLEVALHKAHTLHFPLANIISGNGEAVLPPVSKDFMTAMGRTNDAILFGGFVQLNVNCSDDEARKLAQELPSSASKDYGKTFAEVFKSCNMDFYQIDPLLFSPAKVTINNLETGNSFVAGEFNSQLINKSFNI
ncbi:MAG TPA: methenyltetrahydromethanopterin cyclohydrolase [Methylotenera sp.]|nr:methenyltetrahydromethanopterin cyclohydrolase [Methylotenera sp.]HPV45840.1 methenyltetrahydromethanopterin cyclohydrolase [Methylotenera sp.]